MPEHDPQEDGSAAREISSATMRVMRDYTGRGPTKARTFIARDLVTVVLSDTLTKAEQKLADGGDEQTVMTLRRRFQDTMREDLTAVVEDALGRKVAAFMSANHVDPDMAAEIFVLEPEGS